LSYSPTSFHNIAKKALQAQAYRLMPNQSSTKRRPKYPMYASVSPLMVLPAQVRRKNLSKPK